MGTKSFGRDSVQTIIPLSDKSGLRLTTARYFSPKMKSFSPNGVTPDIIDSGIDEKLIENALTLLKRQNEEKLQ
jgi:carboxyl-terminal processing protease